MSQVKFIDQTKGCDYDLKLNAVYEVLQKTEYGYKLTFTGQHVDFEGSMFEEVEPEQPVKFLKAKNIKGVEQELAVGQIYEVEIEVIDFIEDKKLGFHLGNAVKYISRADKKDPAKTIEDLKKARWYLNREISNLEK